MADNLIELVFSVENKHRAPTSAIGPYFKCANYPDDCDKTKYFEDRRNWICYGQTDLQGRWTRERLEDNGSILKLLLWVRAISMLSPKTRLTAI
jgi:hypothetical protein